VKPTKKSLTHKLDRECSRIIRSQGSCLRCGNTTYSLLQCCHIFSRANRAVRWDLKNLLCLCAGCHFWAHQNPTLFGDFVKEWLGADYTPLKNRAGSIKKWTIEEMQELLKNLEGIR